MSREDGPRESLEPFPNHSRHNRCCRPTGGGLCVPPPSRRLGGISVQLASFTLLPVSVLRGLPERTSQVDSDCSSESASRVDNPGLVCGSCMVTYKGGT